MIKFYIKINKDECFNEIEQRSSCQNICSSETGPVCRGNIHKNIIWPTIKGNDTVKLKCFPTVINKSISNLKAYRTCHILTNEIFSKWQNADISECVQKFLIKIKQDIFQFYTNLVCLQAAFDCFERIFFAVKFLWLMTACFTFGVDYSKFVQTQNKLFLTGPD